MKKRKHMIFVGDWLSLFTVIVSSCIYFSVKDTTSFFMSKMIPSCIQTIFSLRIPLLMDIYVGSAI